MEERINELRKLAENVVTSGFSKEAYDAYQTLLISILSDINKSHMRAIGKTTP